MWMQCICPKQQVKMKGKKRGGWLRWWKWVKSAAREARGWRVPQPWCSEERCCDWLTLPSLPHHTISLACTLQSLSLHTPSSLLTAPPPPLPAAPEAPCHIILPQTGFLPEVHLDTFPIYISLISQTISKWSSSHFFSPFLFSHIALHCTHTINIHYSLFNCCWAALCI